MRQHERQTPNTSGRRRTRFGQLLAAMILLAGCDGATEPGVATYMEAISPTTVTGTVAAEISPAPAVRVTNQHGNPVQGMDVVFWSTAENGVPASTTVRTDASGAATVASWRLHTRAGRQTLRAVMAPGPAGEGREVLFVAIANPAAPAIVLALDSMHAAPPGGNVLLQVRVTDAYGNPIAAALVSFAIESGGGSLEIVQGVTDHEGVARAQWKIGAGGGNTATASVPGLDAVRFSATVLNPPFYFDLQQSMLWTLPFPSWIRIEEDGRFTASTGGVAGGGQYSISGPKIVFTYSDNFLERVGAAFDWWAVEPNALQEGASFDADFIVVRRCWGEDYCYEADWTYRRRAP
ncbi:MAG: Ig-like domain-containing protein [Gemmatimonadaceae bacterium]